MIHKIVFSLALLFAFAVSPIVAQTATKDAAGNYTQVKVAPTLESLESNATKTAATLTTQDGQKLPVYLSKNGKPFTIRKSKTSGNLYRSYIKEVKQ